MTADLPILDDLDDEMLAALGESRLTPSEEARVVERLREHPAERAAFRDLFPGRHAVLFGQGKLIPWPLAPPTPMGEALETPLPLPTQETPVGRMLGRGDVMPPTTPAWRLLTVGLLSSFALLAGIVWPVSPPELSSVHYAPARLRSAELVRGDVTDEGPKNPVFVDLGVVSRWDALRGRAPWGAIVATHGRGKPIVLATSSRRGTCTSTETTLACLTSANVSGLVVVVAAGSADAELDALVNASPDWAALHAALVRTAAHRPWKVHFPLESAAESR